MAQLPSQTPDPEPLPLTQAGGSRFPDYGWAYLSYLLSHVDALGTQDTAEKQELARKAEMWAAVVRKKDRKSVTWNELATLESLLLKLEPDAQLQRKAWMLRNRYRTLVPPDEYLVYTQSNPPPADDPTRVGELRADLAALLSELHFHYDLRTIRERFRAWLSHRATLITLALCLIAIILMWADLQFRNEQGKNIAAIPQSIDIPAAAPLPTTAPPAPAAPSELAAETICSETPEIRLSWKGNGNGESGFLVERRSPGGTWKRVGGGVLKAGMTAFTDSGVAGGQPYEYRLKAYAAHFRNLPVESLPSDAVLVTTVPCARSSAVPLLLYIVVMGALGGFVSLHQRLQQVPKSSDLLSNVIELEHGRWMILGAPLFGAIFAILLYLIFAAGFLKGELFPAIFPTGFVAPVGGGSPFDSSSFGITTFGDFIRRAYPITLVDMAKVLVWSFLAGFAERLVPDTLDRLVTGASKQELGGAPAPPMPQGDKLAARGAGALALAPPSGEGTPTGPLSAHVISMGPEDNIAGPDEPLPIRFATPVADADPVLFDEEKTSFDLQQSWNADRTVVTLTHETLAPGAYTLALPNGSLTLADGTVAPDGVAREFAVAPESESEDAPSPPPIAPEIPTTETETEGKVDETEAAAEDEAKVDAEAEAPVGDEAAAEGGENTPISGNG